MMPYPALRVALGLAAVLGIVSLLGCAPPAREAVESFADVGSDQVIVVGSVELVPPLQPGEQRIKGGNSGQFINRMFLIADEKLRELQRDPGLSDYAGRIEATLGKFFFARSDARPFYILGGMLYLDLGGREMNRAYFPGGFKVALKPGDKAVYIGTIQYHRNEFFEISKIRIVDNYAQAQAEFAKQFGTQTPLRKSLLSGTK